MSLHAKPVTVAEKLALHLETMYGLQLDPARHKGLLSDIESFIVPDKPNIAAPDKSKKANGDA